jgi:hypothetical protein
MLSFSPAMTPTSFHTAELALASGKVFLVCHAVLPMIAGVLSPGPSFEEIRFCDTLLAGRPWDSRPFSILGMDILDMPIEMADLSLLSSAELRDVRFWEPDTVGQLLFNYWD